MIVENSIKISLNKSSLIWKILLYQIIAIVLVGGICLALFYPLFDHLFESGLFTQASKLFADNIYNFNVGGVMAEIGAFVQQLFDVISSNSTLMVQAILFVVVFVFLTNLANSLMEIPVCEVVYGYMGSYTKLNFTGSFVSNLWKGTKFSFCKLITTTIWDVGICALLVFGILQFGHSHILDAILPVALIFGTIVLFSLKQSIFALWLPNLVTNNQKIWKSFSSGIKIAFKNFKTVFGITIAYVVVLFAINFGIGILTCGVGLLFSIPASILLFIVLHTIMFFHFCGLKYYADKDTIITPKKLEDMEKLKNLEKII